MLERKRLITHFTLPKEQLANTNSCKSIVKQAAAYIAEELIKQGAMQWEHEYNIVYGAYNITIYLDYIKDDGAHTNTTTVTPHTSKQP
jgi:hypothetical protein